MICRKCRKEYDVKETIRSYGDMVWTSLYCTAQCYTKAIMENPKALNIIYLVIRHQGNHDDYRSDPVKAFKDEEKAKEFAHLCKQEADRIINEILIWKDAHADLFKLPEWVEEIDEEDEDQIEEMEKHFEQEHKDGVLFFEKITELYKTHKYDSDMNEHDDIDYTVAELELE